MTYSTGVAHIIILATFDTLIGFSGMWMGVMQYAMTNIYPNPYEYLCVFIMSFNVVVNHGSQVVICAIGYSRIRAIREPMRFWNADHA